MNEFEADLPRKPDASSELFAAVTTPSMICNTDGPNQWHLFAEGYSKAAEAAFKAWLNHPGRPEYMVFPVVYLQRHYLELRLKELIQSAANLQDTLGEWQFDHDIPRLWSSLKPLLQQEEPELVNTSDFIHSERLIVEFGKRDLRSMMFRYPVDKKGATHLTETNQFDLINFMEVMERLSCFLDGISMGLSVYRDWKADLTAYNGY